MNVQPMSTTAQAAWKALREYKAHRDVYDKRDWEIERIYRAIAKGKTVISVNDAIRRAGLDDFGRPKLAIMRADQSTCRCERCHSDRMIFGPTNRSRAADLRFVIPWPGKPPILNAYIDAVAPLPRIPPQHRPTTGSLRNYHVLWEADWADIPRDPYLLKRIGKDAWVVLAAWDLTEVEMSVLRAHA
jgi:hypothetical protein